MGRISYGIGTSTRKPIFSRLVCAVAIGVLPAMPAFALFSDNFAGPSLNPGWTYVHPNASSTLTVNTGATMTASLANGGSDLYSGTNYNAPRILQPIDPAQDWLVETKLVFNPTINAQVAGILLTTTNGAITSNTQYNEIAARGYTTPWGSFFGTVGTGGGGPGQSSVTYTGTTTYMRVGKSGTTYSEWYSADGSAWTFFGSQVDATPYTYVGVDVVRQWFAGADSSANFVYFNQVPEPGSLALLGLGAAGLLARRRR